VDFEGVYGGLGRIAIVKQNSGSSGTARDFGEFKLFLNSNVNENSYSAFQECLNIDPSNGLTYSYRGSDQLKIDSSGRVGINTASPSATLDARGAVRLGNQASGDGTTVINTSNGVYIGTNSGTTTTTVVPFQIGAYPAGPGYTATPDQAIVLDGWSGGAVYHNAIVNRKGRDLSFHTAITGNGFSDTNERARITSDGKLGLGTSSPQALLHISNGGAAGVEIDPVAAFNGPYIQSYNRSGSAYTPLDFIASNFYWYNSGSPVMRLDTSGRLGIGSTAPDSLLDVAGGNITLTESTNVIWKNAARDTNRGAIQFDSSGNLRVRYGSALNEGYRLDSSGRLLVGTPTSAVSFADWRLQVLGQSLVGSFIGANASSYKQIFIKSRSSAVGTYTIVNSGDSLGGLDFRADDGTDYLSTAASITAEVDGTPGANDMPGRLVFSTTADGDSSPDPRMTIKSDGDILFEKTSNSSTTRGFEYRTGSENLVLITNSNAVTASPLIRLNRQSSDGDLISFRHADTEEGLISVSGTTVTYGGGHLARWSQLPNDEDPSNILKGTVMSNLDEMCEWGEEDNEQLNKTKVSDVEGDPNVAGVFVSTSSSEDGPLDFFVGMTGDMIIRIANGVTVQRGDLLMSAGDGTAKPQGDDIIRSKTIAKVTSTHVTCTYDDGSYCVPCVLMAC